MASPFLALVEELRALRGNPKVSYESGDEDFPTTERVFELKRGEHLPTFGQAEPDAGRFPDNVLTQQLELASDPQYVRVYRRYEVLPGKAVIVSDTIDPEMLARITVARQKKLATAITPSATITGGNLVIVSKDGEEGYAATETVTTITPPARNSFSNAQLGTRAMAYQWPARINILQLDVYGKAIGYHRPRARLLEATAKTFWVISDTKPTLTFDKIVGRTIQINGEFYEDVLHDATTRSYNGFAVFIPATTPSYSTYVASWIGQQKLVDGEVEATRYQKLWKVTGLFIEMQ